MGYHLKEALIFHLKSLLHMKHQAIALFPQSKKDIIKDLLSVILIGA